MLMEEVRSLSSVKRRFEREEKIVKLGDRKGVEGKEVFSFVSDSSKERAKFLKLSI